MSKDLSTYYVYEHRDPQTDELVYIGIGRAWRAWATGSSRFTNPASKAYGRRDLWHAGWLEDQYEKGFLPSEWVKITHRQLSKELATTIEKGLIEGYRPKFNKNHNKDNKERRKYTEEDIQKIQALRAEGKSYKTIQEELGYSSPMTVWRIDNE